MSELKPPPAGYPEPQPGTKALPGPFDAFESAKPDEPIFTLQGGDKWAPELVLVWARKARTEALAVEESKPARALELKLRATSAEGIAWNMQAYQKGYPADSNESEAYTQSRSEAAGLEVDGALRQLVRHKTLVQLNRDLSDAVARIAGAEEALASLREEESEALPVLVRKGALAELARQLKLLAGRLLPQRVGRT